MDALAIADRKTSDLEERPPEHRGVKIRGRRETKQAEVVTLASLPPGTLYRVVDDYEALQDAFTDRIEELDTPLTEIDAAGGMTRGNMQKCLSKSDAPWSRQFGWRTLGAALKGTGLALAVIIDDERFAAVKAQMVRRKLRPR